MSRSPAHDPRVPAALPLLAVPTATSAGRGTAPDRRRIESQALFDGQIEIEIEHFEQVYRLRQTSLGKLILTK